MIMKRKIFYIFFSLISITTLCSAQQLSDKINYITFKLYHSKRIPHQSVAITINKKNNEYWVHVSSIPKDSNIKWKQTSIDTTYKLDNKIFIELANDVLTLPKIDLNKAFVKPGLDGTTCSIEFGTFGNTIAFNFWTPDSDTENRDLTDYLEICKRIITIGRLNPEDIL